MKNGGQSSKSSSRKRRAVEPTRGERRRERRRRETGEFTDMFVVFTYLFVGNIWEYQQHLRTVMQAVCLQIIFLYNNVKYCMNMWTYV